MKRANNRKSVLPNNLSSAHLRYVNNSQLASILSDEESWDFTRKLKDQDIEIIQLIGKCLYVKQVRLSSNRRESIISDINCFTFANIKMLDIGSNNITSIEPLCTVTMLTLQRLNLYNNSITNYTPLRRCHFPALIYLTLQSNPSTNSLSCLSEMELNTLYWFWVEHKSKESVMNDGLHWLMKTNMPKLVELVLKSKNRLIQDALMEQVRRKYIDIKIVI